LAARPEESGNVVTFVHPRLLVFDAWISSGLADIPADVSKFIGGRDIGWAVLEAPGDSF
jgi:hypothetical protein